MDGDTNDENEHEYECDDDNGDGCALAVLFAVTRTRRERVTDVVVVMDDGIRIYDVVSFFGNPYRWIDDFGRRKCLVSVFRRKIL